ncbi:MAG: tRNA (N6-threonylcarbamoyladenosine(37)-N6)-methyltransferase TrmO [Methanomassiliicoccus sp.]|nr:tRNA (N6-threonylcarbamoyladenosine(37)-N6)-methyltransferase TrmO [Methanomassiliicoccus sp.]
MELRPIGTVRSVRGEISEIEVLPELADGLYRIGENRKLLILFQFHRSEGFDLRVHPKGDAGNPLVGVFASRAPRRPNPIGATEVRLLKVEGAVLTVEGLDAFEGSPVLDIKPLVRRDLLVPDLHGKD